MASPHRIVVGIDFGTTYSAIAWGSSNTPDQLEVLHNWPTSGQLVGQQVPSEIAYANESEGVYGTDGYSWGYDISPKAKKVCLKTE